jgi:hypothetical protein
MVGAFSHPDHEEVKISRRILKNVLFFCDSKIIPFPGHLASRTEFFGTPGQSYSQNPGLARENQDKGESLRKHNCYKGWDNPAYFDL